ncbi:MAG: bifunctional diaminohydroxyphosphoribosylaminopyrimidine deaminase/5-amino-6-(5-phosphoribosylamino)uracil reductase RibD [Thermoanaerobacteraceae bacterium]|jgi:diaminohydroxyphosphoribosylaminopyrimidine deaminase/5-amino-6-(5-phosphoribosylamino)uracil reductase|nr:bifunctional diaminohydroxyphosphoribosylaminopyrimidine deaminase/5-amino-6-(5-phosphoribosylamino)uracil reductase RibD [Thermoanaerobacteraceae bacterium]
MKIDEYFMQRALELAEKGRGATGENPMVGAVLVKDGKILGEGYHKKAGGAHAEIEALKAAGPNANGATMYVNLEPCSHYGKTPPCTEAIIKAGIARVVAAMEDPNPKVSGRGFKKLKDAGIDVAVGVLEDKALKLNEVFVKNMSHKTPFVVAKIAQTMDGKIALSSGKSKWITGEASRKKAHELRNVYDAVLVGIGTVLADNPRLNCRLANKTKDPIKIILDSSAQLPMESKVLDSGKVILAATSHADEGRLRKLQNKGVEVIKTSQDTVNLKELLMKLFDMGICSVLIEGGPRVFTSFLKEELLDKLVVFLAPKIIGADGKACVGRLFIKEIEHMYEFNIDNAGKIGEDIMLEMYPKKD